MTKIKELERRIELKKQLLTLIQEEINGMSHFKVVTKKVLAFLKIIVDK